MQFSFSGHQSGVWATLAGLLRGLNIHNVQAQIEGRHTLTQSADRIEGLIVGHRTFRYARNIAIRTPLYKEFTVGCPHATDEDFSADLITLTFDLPPASPALASPDDVALRLLREWDNTKDLNAALDRVSKGLEAPGHKWPYILLARLVAPADFTAEICKTLYQTPRKLELEEEAVNLLHMNLYHELASLTQVARDDLLNLLEVAFCHGSLSSVLLAYIAEIFSWALSSAPSKQLLNRHIELLSYGDDDVRQSSASTICHWLRNGVSVTGSVLNKLAQQVRHLLGHPSAKLRLAAIGVIGALITNAGTIGPGWDLLAEAVESSSEPGTDDTIKAFRENTSVRFCLQKTVIEAMVNSLSLPAEFARLLTNRAINSLSSEKKAFLFEWEPYLRRRVHFQKGRVVFVDFPHVETEFLEVVRELQETLRHEQVKVWIACDEGVTVFTENILWPRISEGIRTAAMVIVNLSQNNFNVGYEFGLAERYGVPILLVREAGAPWFFDTQGHYLAHHFEYKRDDPNSLAAIKDALLKAIREFFSSTWPVQSEGFEGLLGGLGGWVSTNGVLSRSV